MEIKLSRSVIVSVGRASHDPEKSILPTIIFVNTNHPEYNDRHRGFIVAFGWWDLHLTLEVSL